MRLSDQIERVQNRGPGFDRIRLIAAFVVVLHHCTTYVTSDISHDFLFAWSGGLVTAGSLAVAIFFATSGTLVVPGLLRGGDIVAFTVNRVLRIMPALILTVLLTVLVAGPVLTRLGLQQYFQEPGTWGYLANLVFRTAKYLPGVAVADGTPIIVNGALWTLYFEVLSYVALVIVFRLGLLSSRWIALAAFALVYGVNAACYYAPELAARLPDSLVVFLSLFVYFFAGVCLYRFANLIPFGWRTGVAAALLAALCMPLGLGVLALPLLVPYVVVSIGYSTLLGRKPLKADYSYGVYLNHAVVLTVLLILWPQMDNYLGGVGIVGGAALLLAALSWHLVESPALHSKKAAREMLRRWRQSLWPRPAPGPATAPASVSRATAEWPHEEQPS